MADESPAWGPDDEEGSCSKEEKEPVMVRYVSLTQKGKEAFKNLDETLEKVKSAKSKNDLQSVTLLKEGVNASYYDYVGRVEVKPTKFGLGDYVIIVDRKTGKQLCEIDSDFKEEFLKYDGKVISFRGKLNKHYGLVKPHNK